MRNPKCSILLVSEFFPLIHLPIFFYTSWLSLTCCSTASFFLRVLFSCNSWWAHELFFYYIISLQIFLVLPKLPFLWPVLSLLISCSNFHMKNSQDVWDVAWLLYNKAWQLCNKQFQWGWHIGNVRGTKALVLTDNTR